MFRLLFFSAANDGLGYPFLFLAVYLMKLSGGEVVKEWVIEAVLRGVFLSVAIGALLGTGARLMLKKCHAWYVDQLLVPIANS